MYREFVYCVPSSVPLRVLRAFFGSYSTINLLNNRNSLTPVHFCSSLTLHHYQYVVMFVEWILMKSNSIKSFQLQHFRLPLQFSNWSFIPLEPSRVLSTRESLALRHLRYFSSNFNVLIESKIISINSFQKAYLQWKPRRNLNKTQVFCFRSIFRLFVWKTFIS